MEVNGCSLISGCDELAVAVKRKSIEGCREGGEVYRNVSNFSTGSHCALCSSAGVHSG